MEITGQGSFWGGGGLSYDYTFAPNWYLTPSLGAGLYTHSGNDIDLDYPVQFRSQLDLAYKRADTSRLGVSFSHMSHAHLGDSNRGTEVISLFYQIPLKK